MPVLKRILLALLLPLLPLLLFLLALDFAVLRVAGDPQPIKEHVKESGIYDSAIDTLLKTASSPDQKTSTEISPDNPIVREAFKKAFPPGLIEAQTENFIDSIYRWLKGDTTVPDFRLDLTQAKAVFVEEVAASAENRAANLPVCPRGQIEFSDPFSATCLPRGASPSLAAEKIRSELGNNESFLSDPVLTADSFKSGKNPEKSVFAGSSLPGVYQNLKQGRTLLIALTLLVIAGVIFLSPSLRLGARRVGTGLLLVGAGVLIAVFITNKVFTEALPDILAKSENPVLNGKLEILIENLVRNTNKVFSAFGWAYTALGVGIVAGTIFIQRGNKKTPEVNTGNESDSQRTD